MTTTPEQLVDEKTRQENLKQGYEDHVFGGVFCGKLLREVADRFATQEIDLPEAIELSKEITGQMQKHNAMQMAFGRPISAPKFGLPNSAETEPTELKDVINLAKAIRNRDTSDESRKRPRTTSKVR